MNTRWLVYVTLLFLVGAGVPRVLQAEEDATPEAGGVKWVKRLDAALAQAKARGQTVLVFCYFSRSPAARHLKESVWSDPDVARALARHFVPLLLNSDAIDSERSGTVAMSRLGITMIPTHLVLDATGRTLITERALPAADSAQMLKWIGARAANVKTYGRLTAKSQERPKDPGPKIKRLWFLLEMATRLGRVGGHMVVHQPPASARNRQIDAVAAEAKALASALDKAKNASAQTAWVIWAQASLAAGVDKQAALTCLDGVLDDLAKAADPEGAIIAFNTAYALFETDPAAARPYLARVIKSWSDSGVYWEARVYEAYSYGRTGDQAKATELYKAIVREGPAANSWVRSAKKKLQQLAELERGRKQN